MSGIHGVTVDRDQLLAILTTNRDKHHDVFVRAVEVWRAQALALVNEWADEIAKGKRPRLYSDLPEPEEHTDDYDRNIGMLKMHTEKTVELPEEAYMRLVGDDWGWSDMWASNTASYLAVKS